METDSRTVVRFSDFTLDARNYQLRRNGRTVRLERQPLDLLILLVERGPELVTHREIADRLWGNDVFVDVETGIHGAVRKIRRALRDSPDRPAFIETVPARGYRFIAPVERLTTATAVAVGQPAGERSNPPTAEAESTGRRRKIGGWSVAAVLLAAIVLVALLASTGFLMRGSRSRVTLAVLPVENLSGDVDRNYLADGLAEEVEVALDKIAPDRVSVVSRAAVKNLQTSTTSAPELARKLGVDYVVDSSIRTEGGRVRIIAKLIRVDDYVQVWSESYSREPASVLELQQELSAAIADQIRVRLSPATLEMLERRQTRDPEAYDLYLRGLNFASQRTPPTTAKAIEYYQRATALDPGYALAWAGMAFALTASPMNGDANPLEVLPSARHAAAQAIRADPALAEAQFAQGYLDWMIEWNWPAAEAALRRAVALDARFAQAHVTLGHAVSQSGRHREAEPWLQRARELEPLLPLPFAMSSQVAFQGRDYPAALEFAREAIARDRELWIGHMMRGQVLERMNSVEAALESLTTAERFSGQNSKAMSLRAYLLARTGRADEARDVLKALSETARHRYVPPSAFALIHAGLGDRDAVFEWLTRAYTARDVHLIFLPVDSKWDPYRTDPRFVELLTRCGFR
jgi:TolB-like protein/DNA-binding winged helix-turn-helix (wHTH) protein/Flp pilus assembly protein TadD